MRRREGHRPPSRAVSQAGFTLIEVLAALVVTGAFVAVALPYAGRLATHWWMREATIEAADGWMQAVNRMGDDLSQAVAFDIGAGGGPILAFRAGPDDVGFVRPGLGDTGRLEAVTYEIRPSRAGMALIRRSRRFDSAAFAHGDRGSPTTLLEGPFRLRLVEVSVDGSRRRDWSPSSALPAGIELSAVDTRERTGAGAAVPPLPVFLPIAARASAAAAAGASGAP